MERSLADKIETPDAATATAEQIAEWMAKHRTRAQQIYDAQPAYTGPRSARMPDKPKSCTTADKIHDLLQDEGQSCWGLVIYRCTYDDDSAWAEFMTCLETDIRQACDDQNAADVYAKHKRTVLDSRAQFEGATPTEVREHFLDWRLHAHLSEQGTPYRAQGQAPRYTYFLHVDQQAMHDVVESARVWPAKPHGPINLVSADRGPGTLLYQDPPSLALEAIDGETAYNVGWMRVRYTDYFDVYDLVTKPGIWDTMYIRPPGIYLD